MVNIGSIAQQYAARSVRSRHIACVVILTVHAVLTVVYSLTTPLWESFDEPGHYSYARYISIHHALPPVGAQLSETDETHQPPLYYILVAIPMSFVDTSDDAQPKFTAGGNTFVVADPKVNTFPYQGTALAFRLGRMVSVILSTIAVAITYAIVRTAFPARPGMALLAAAIHGVWPLYLFLGGMISNDVGISLAGSVTLLFVVRLWVKPSNAPRRWDYLGLVISLICATQTKDNGLALVLFAVLAIGALVLRDLKTRNTRRLIELFYLTALMVILFVLGGILTNGRSFRQVTKTVDIVTNLFQAVAPVAAAGQSLVQRVSATLGPYLERIPGWTSITLSTVFTSYSWGFLNVPAQWLLFAAVAGIIALAGIVIALVQRKTRSVILLMLLGIGCVSLASIVGGTAVYYHGRVVLPSLSAIVVLLTIGLYSLPRLVRRASALYALAVVQMIALMSPALVIAPVYQRPPLLDPVATPSGMQVPSALTFGDSIRLLGYAQPDAQTTRGQDAVITLYWQALRPMQTDYALKLELFSINGESMEVQSQTTPGNNNFPTSFWEPGDTFAETYRLPIRLDAPAPTVATFKITWFGQQTSKISWYRTQTDDVLQPTCDGAPCEPKVGALPVKLDSAALVQWTNKPALYRLGSHIEMIDYQEQTLATAGQALILPVVWRTGTDNPGNFTTFVHLFAPDGTLVAQSDSPPRHGQYPTEVWRAHEVIPDNYTLPLTSTLPAGVYHLKMGMYDTKTHDRLPAFDREGKALTDNVIPLQEIAIYR